MGNFPGKPLIDLMSAKLLITDHFRYHTGGQPTIQPNQGEVIMFQRVLGQQLTVLSYLKMAPLREKKKEVGTNFFSTYFKSLNDH